MQTRGVRERQIITRWARRLQKPKHPRTGATTAPWCQVWRARRVVHARRGFITPLNLLGAAACDVARETLRP
jgi:hypothetical protein